MVCADRNRAKMSESPPSDSRCVRPLQINFPEIVRAGLISHRDFLFSRANGDAQLPHCTQIELQRANMGRASESEFLLQDFVDRLRARLAAGRFHHPVSYTHL